MARFRRTFVCLLAASVTLVTAAEGRQPAPAVDRVFRISGSVGPQQARPAGGYENVLFAIYGEEQGGTPLWQEVQTLAVDGQGNYTVLLGATSAAGLPVDLFASGAPRWLATEVQGDSGGDLPRVVLTSVPYSLRAATADNALTLAGRPASDFQLTRAARGTDAERGATTGAPSPADREVDPQVNSGTANFIGKFQNNVDLVNSAMFENAGKIGIGTTTPADFLHARFSDTTGGFTGFAVQNLGNSPMSYSGMLFYDHTGALGQFQGFNNSTKEYRINNIAAGGSINFMLGSTSRFRVAPGGNIGIGTTSPAAPLHVNGVIRSDAGYNIGANRVLGVPGAANLFVGQFAGLVSTGASNTFVGDSAGANTTSGSGNSFLGAWAGIANTTGGSNTFVGQGAGTFNAGGNANTFVGQSAGRANSYGGFNTFVGAAAGDANQNGLYNTFIGYQAGSGSLNAYSNTFVGQSAGRDNTTGQANTFVGDTAGMLNTAASFNSFIGQRAGWSNTTGYENTFVGQDSGFSNTTGYDNTFLGQGAGRATTIAPANTFIGQAAGESNIDGNVNTFVGRAAGRNNVSGCCNTFIGSAAGNFSTTGHGNTFLGDLSGLTHGTGDFNTLLGYRADVAAGNLTNATAIGFFAQVSQSNALVLGSIDGVNGASANTNVGIGVTAPVDRLHVAGDIRVGSGTIGCVKDADGTVIAGTCSSDLRFKMDVRPFRAMLDRVAELRPVTFHWRAAEFPEKSFGARESYGLVAQEVEQVLPELVVRDAQGYRAVNYSKLPLLTIQAVKELKAETDALRSQNAELSARLDVIEHALRELARTRRD